jgi:hypothetical protein
MASADSFGGPDTKDTRVGTPGETRAVWGDVSERKVGGADAVLRTEEGESRVQWTCARAVRARG